MAFAPTRSFLSPLVPSPSSPFKPSLTTLSPKPPIAPPKLRWSFLACASSSSDQPPPPFTSEQAVLEAVADFDANENRLPAVRTFENDLVRLSLVGAVDFQQALTAAAADGGEAADEHVSAGVAAMVVETIFPGHVDDRSTVATRLFLPAGKVKEKALKLKRSLTKDMFNNTSSKNILAMTFRQVVLRQLWSLELALFRPGTERDMDDLENPREVPASLTLSSSDEDIIAKIAEVVCFAALENTERHFHQDSTSRASNKFFSWFNKRNQISSRDSFVVLYNLLEHEILANSTELIQKFNLERGKHKSNGTKLKNNLWMSPAISKLEKIGGLEFCVWLSEYIPSYMLRIDAGKLTDVKFEGWKKSEANCWEIVLTHSQMVSLADVLDMYYEDVYTLPNKRLSCSVAKPSNLALNKGGSLLKILSVVLASGFFILAIGILRKLYLPNLPRRKISIQEYSRLQSDISSVPHHSLEFSKLEACCVSIVKRIKDNFGWSEEIETKYQDCAWVGELPTYLRNVDDNDPHILGTSSTSMRSGENDREIKELEDIASYQVVLSTEENIIGFQPTNRVAVNNWAANPLAKELYGGKHLSPGLLEPGLGISRPTGLVVLELLMSTNPSSYFALVRAVDTSGIS